MVHSAVHGSQFDNGAPWLQAQEDKLALYLNQKKLHITKNRDENNKYDPSWRTPKILN